MSALTGRRLTDDDREYLERWPNECVEEVTDKDGFSRPCDKTAVAARFDPNAETDNAAYPVCARHARGEMATLADLLHLWDHHDRAYPLQCRFKLDHLGDHDWQIEKSPLTDYRAKLLREEDCTPSGMLPRRTPGAALGDAGSTSDGSPDVGESPGPLESAFPRVIERWRA